jgi:hypothetical protein
MGVNLPVTSLFTPGILIQFPCSNERPAIRIQVSTSFPYVSYGKSAYVYGDQIGSYLKILPNFLVFYCHCLRYDFRDSRETTDEV